MSADQQQSLRYQMGLNQGGYLNRSMQDLMGAAGQSVNALTSNVRPRLAQLGQRMGGVTNPMMNMVQGLGMNVGNEGGMSSAPSAVSQYFGGGSGGNMSQAPSAVAQYFGGGAGDGGNAAPPTTGNAGGGKGGSGGGKGRSGGGKGRPSGGSASANPMKNALMNRNLLLGGGTLIGASGGLAETLQGNPVGGVTSMVTGGGLGATGAALMRSRSMPAKIVGGLLTAASPAVGSMLGDRAEAAYAEATGTAPKGSDSVAAQKAAGRTTRQQDAQVDLEINQGILNQERANIKDLAQFQQDLMITGLKRQEPIIERMKRNELVRNQAMANTMTNNYAMLGTLATAGRLAEGAQQQAGANFRTALTNNPYANNVMRAPQINFG